MTELRPFRIDVPETVLTDLRRHPHHHADRHPAEAAGRAAGLVRRDVLVMDRLRRPPGERLDPRRNTEMPRGHFAALEEPELLVGDLRAFFGTVR